ncbi:MAG: hypothetical protein CMO98_11165 [Woeseia sp.]|nr:hypothetical protein [Woeseia sp.]|tara:strand:- start:16 stop:819 length:804 start_codon:yes stop_codon:yes gene_type:complete
MKPNFLVIGAPRSGTTWIARNLMQHPEVFIPRAKETHYFDRHYDSGMSHYETYFEPVESELAIGEATPDYLACEPCAGRIKQDLGTVKLIVSLRNPVDRLYSRYWNTEGRVSKRTGRSFEERIGEVPSWVSEGFYDDHLERYFSLFPKSDVLVLLYDVLKSNPEKFFQDIVRFIGVNERMIPESVSHRMNAAGAKPLNGKSMMLYATHRVARRLNLEKLSSRLDAMNQNSLPVMRSDTRKRLVADVYGRHIENLEKLLDVDLSSWRS